MYSSSILYIIKCNKEKHWIVSYMGDPKFIRNRENFQGLTFHVAEQSISLTMSLATNLLGWVMVDMLRETSTLYGLSVIWIFWEN